MIQEASGGCGRHVLDLVSGLDPNQFDITLMYGKERAELITFRGCLGLMMLLH